MKSQNYTITNYTKRKAKQLGVTVRLSHTNGKKIDVFDKKGKKLASVGAAGMNDYPTYMRTRGNRYARKRRSLYRIRHRKDRTKRGTRGWWADKLLW